MKHFATLALLLCMAFAFVSLAQADMAPPNSQYVKHSATFHGAKAFPKYQFVLLGVVTPLKEGTTFPFLKFGGWIAAIPKTVWKKQYVGKPQAQRLLTRAKAKKRGFPLLKKSLYFSVYVTRPTTIVRQVTRVTVTGIKGGIIQIKRVTKSFDKAGKLVSTQKKGKKTSMNTGSAKPSYTLAAVPFGVIALAFLALFFGIRRSKS